MRQSHGAGSVAARAGAAGRAHAPNEQSFPLQSYRVGPYAAGGTGFFGGFIDYMNLINTRDGGVNGVKLTWDEVRDPVRRRARRRVLRALEEAGPDRRRRWTPALGRHRLRHDRPRTADKVPLITDQPRPHRLHRRPRLPLRLPAASPPTARPRHRELHRREGGRPGQAQGQEDRRSSTTARPTARRPIPISTCWRRNTASRSRTSRCRIRATSSSRSG